MTTTSISPASLNVDAADANSAAAIMVGITAACARRPHLREAITSIRWEKEQGISVLVVDAGQREHLANALGLKDGRVEAKHLLHNGRRGYVDNVKVVIWSPE